MKNLVCNTITYPESAHNKNNKCNKNKNIKKCY